MAYEELFKRLREPFGSKEIEWKIQVTTQDKTRGLAVAYMDARAVQKRLDEVVGPFDWKNVYSLWHEKAQICGISIFNAERNEWVTKFDGAENTDVEPIKGGLSDSFKRAACIWGIGRYLYEIEGVWVELESKGKSFVIKQNQYGKLDAAYNTAVNKIFGIVPNPGTSYIHGVIQNHEAIEENAINATDSGADPNHQAANKFMQQRAMQKAQSAPKPEGNNYDYKVKSVKPTGKSSQMLELVDSDGEPITAYIKNANQSIVIGSLLQNVRIERKKSEHGEYNLINAYKLAA